MRSKARGPAAPTRLHSVRFPGESAAYRAARDELLRAEMDLVCGLTACSAEDSNNGSFKPIDYAILG